MARYLHATWVMICIWMSMSNVFNMFIMDKTFRLIELFLLKFHLDRVILILCIWILYQVKSCLVSCGRLLLLNERLFLNLHHFGDVKLRKFLWMLYHLHDIELHDIACKNRYLICISMLFGQFYVKLECRCDISSKCSKQAVVRNFLHERWPRKDDFYGFPLLRKNDKLTELRRKFKQLTESRDETPTRSISTMYLN